jgi:hypothetical protein
MHRTAQLRSVVIATACWSALSGAAAGVTVRFDEAAVNELLPALAAQEVRVPLGTAGTVAVKLQDLRVVAFEPAEGSAHPGFIRTSLRATVPSLGISAPLEPRLSLRLERSAQENVLRLRFERITMRLPLVGGAVDLAPFVDPMDFPVDSFHALGGVGEETHVRSRLSAVDMEAHAIRFEFDVDVVQSAGGS